MASHLPFDEAVGLLRAFESTGSARIRVNLWLGDAVNGPAIEMRGFVNDIEVHDHPDEGRAVVLASDEWFVCIDEARADFVLSDAALIAQTRDGNEIGITFGS